MTELDDDIARGYLANGEPLEAKWGTGWWSGSPDPEPDYYGAECPFCHQKAWYCDNDFLSCEKCGHTANDPLPPSDNF